MSLTIEKRSDLQIIQNDVLRICNGSKLSDRISIELLHNKANLLSQRTKEAKTITDVDVYLFERGKCTTYTCKSDTKC